jgi:hypothetical protein
MLPLHLALLPPCRHTHTHTHTRAHTHTHTTRLTLHSGWILTPRPTLAPSSLRYMGSKAPPNQLKAPRPHMASARLTSHHRR